jgi:endonuclease YncB( thermonuclease family)
MELASRIVSIVLGAAVMVLLLWPITVPLGFSEAWWASRQAQSQARTPPAPRPQPDWARLPAPDAKPKAASPPPAPSAHAVTPGVAAAPKPAPAAGEKPAPPEQLAALKEQDTGTVTPKETTKRYYRVKVRDAGTLQSGKVVIRLAGITAREADAACKDAAGKSWPCGAAAKTALTGLIRARAVTCALPKSGEQNIFDGRCAVGGTDLATWLVRQGWATPKAPNEAALAKAAAAAKSEKLGLWRSAE